MIRSIHDIHVEDAAGGRPSFSIEFFPPKTEEGERKLFAEVLPALRSLPVGYCSVTYGAGGSTRDSTLRIVEVERPTPLAFPHPKVTVVPLPNVGRESHTYAHHFEQRWGDLSDSVVCCQGGFDDHLSHADFEAMVLGHGQSVAHGLDVPWGSTMMAALHWTPEKNYAPQPMQPAGMTLAQYFLKYIDNDLVPGAQLQWWVGAIFRVTASDVRRHPPARYRAIKRSLESGSNPEAGHYMERFWRALLLGAHTQFDRA